MDKKSILVYTENYLPSMGGLENNTLLLCESLVSLNYEVTLITPQKNALKHHHFKVIESKSILFFYTEIKKHHLVIVNGGVSFKIIFPSLLAFKPFLIIYQMATLFNDIRNDNLKTRFLNYARKCLAFLAQKNIAVSTYSFLELERTFGKRSAGLLINPADPLFSHHEEDKLALSKPFKCLFAGRLIDGKGIRLLIEAMHHINKEQVLIHLDVFGDGPEKDFVINESGHSYIDYHPPVDKTKLKNWFQKTHLTIIPSTSHIEGSPLIMAESLMMGTPVLVSSQPAMVASIDHQNLIFESGNLLDLIEKLKFLIEERNYTPLQIFCKKISLNYSYTNYINNLKSMVNV
jgi:glycosyltransferase involved in cell wall biosynthesis